MPIRLDEPLQEKILQTLSDRIASTSQLSQYTHTKLSKVRRELIRFHHLGVVKIVGVHATHGGVPAKSYFQDYNWGMTKHGEAHHQSVRGCRACSLRNLRLLRASGLA